MISATKPEERCVVVLQHRLLHYRTELFDRLRQRCFDLGIRLELVVGQASAREAVRRDEGHLPWAHKVRNRFLALPNRDLLWQPLPRGLRSADLVVVMQENRILSNYPLLLRRWFGGRQRVAYWGHGRNFQTDAPDGWRERWKRLMLTKVDWWFAYTETSCQLVREAGFPADRITCLDNAIDTDGFRRDLASISEQELQQARSNLGLAPGDAVALFCGSLYRDKKLDLLIAAMDKVRNVRTDMPLLVIGDGPAMPQLRQAAATRPWIKLLGVRQGREKALFYRMASVILNPGTVGLHIVDAFCAGLVMITTKTAKHSPEVAYIRDGINGLFTKSTADDYAQSVVSLVADPTRLSRMQAAALSDAGRYTLGNMVERFAQGLMQALRAPETNRGSV